MDPNASNFERSNLTFLNIFMTKGAIHGLPYVGTSRITIVERIMWFVLTLLALSCSILLALESLNRFRNKSTVISIERDHHYWNTTVASITVCPMQRLNKDKFNDYSKHDLMQSYYFSPHRSRNIQGTDKSELFEFLESLANSTYFNMNDIKDYPSIEKYNIEPKDYIYLINNLTENKLFSPYVNNRTRAFENHIQINTQLVLTEWGMCYLTNNFLADDLSTTSLLTGKPPSSNPYIVKENLRKTLNKNLYDGGSTIQFMGFNGPFYNFIHGAHEVMAVEKRLEFANLPVRCQAETLEITASDDFERSTSVEQRQCRFPHESNLTHFPIYTRNICHQECRINLAFKLCKCIPHFYPNLAGKKPVCHYKVLKNCLFQYAEIFENLHKIDQLSLDNDAIQCYCLPNCRSSEVTQSSCRLLQNAHVLINTYGVVLDAGASPRLRYRRQIIFTLTDLLVSIGGTVGFFIGSSVLSAVEMLYYFTMRLFWHCMGYKE